MSWSSYFFTFVRDERVILTTLGLATAGIISTMVTALTITRDNNEIPPTEPKTQYITQDTEDSLDLTTIDKLISHPNYSIREVAIKILCDRAINDDDCIEALLRGITNENYDERMEALRALALLTGYSIGLEGLSKLNKPKAYSALVRSLELCLCDLERPSLNDEHWDEYFLRDMAERLCLMFVLELSTKYGVDLLIRARFVEKWLAQQDWGDSQEERKRNFKNYVELKGNRIVDIIKRIMESRRGLHALEEAELLEKSDSRSSAERVLIMEFGERGPASSSSRRTREHSAEEQRLRRQHREAMVLNDGTRPLGREDIIERNPSPPTP
jgi:hypothetical protein